MNALKRFLLAVIAFIGFIHAKKNVDYNFGRQNEKNDI